MNAVDTNVLPSRRASRWRILAVIGATLAGVLAMPDVFSGLFRSRDVAIETSIPAASFGPGIRAEPLVSVGLRPDYGEGAQAAVKAVRTGLSKYPRGFPGKFIRATYLVGSLTYRGVEVGGLCPGDVVILNIGPGRTNYGDGRSGTERSFHHELAHAVLRSADGILDTLAWTNANMDGFRYGAGGFAYLKARRVSPLSPDILLDSGFVSDYSRSALEEDFCEIVAIMFTADAESWSLIQTKPRIRTKAMLAAQVLHSLDSRFSWAYFDGMFRRGDNMNTSLVPRDAR